MSRLRGNFFSGAISDNPLSSGATTINSSQFATLPVVTNPDVLVLTLDPLGAVGAPEIVTVTAHTSSATSVTVTRAAEGTSARSHNQNEVWVWSPTALDYWPTPADASVSALQGTTSTSFVDLTTAGPTVTMTTGSLVKVTMFCTQYNDTANFSSEMGFAISGATTQAATDAFALVHQTSVANSQESFGASWKFSVTAGSNTFTAKYRAPAGHTAFFGSRYLLVEPLPGP